MAYKGFKGLGPLRYGSPIKNITEPDPAGDAMAEPTADIAAGVDPATGGQLLDPAGNPMGGNMPLMSNEEVMSQTINTKYGEEPVIPSGMTTGTDNYLDEVVITAGPREQTRVEHRLDKTQAKGEAAAEAGNYKKANRLQARKQRLLKRAERQENKDKKRYARKDKKFWRDQQEQPKVQ
jgi:hypothetical protein